MSNVDTQQAQMSKSIQALVEKPFGNPVMIQSPSGMVSLYNTHLISAKLQGIVGAMLNLEEWSTGGPDVMSIVFRGDGMPVKEELKQIFAVSHLDVHAFAVNLVRNFNEALEICLEVEPALCITAALWNELLTSIAHEIHHVAVMSSISAEDVESWSEDDLKDEEAKAKEWARMTILQLVKDGVDIEPPSLDEEPLFQMMFMAENLKRLADPNTTDEMNAAWTNQLKMLSNGWAWHDPESGTTCESFVNWITIEEAGEGPIESGKVIITNNDNGAESEPMAAPAFQLIPSNSAMTHIETTGVIVTKTDAPAQNALNLAFSGVKQTATPVPATDGSPDVVMTDKAVPLVASAEMAEAMELAEMFEDEFDYGADPEPGNAAIPPAQTPQQASAQNSLFSQSVADEVVPEPAPDTVPEMTQAFDPNQVAATTKAIYMRCFQHIFTKCAPVNGIFQNPGAVYEPINIADIPGHEVLVGCNTIDQDGRFKQQAHVPGWIKGTLFGNGSLPAYHIYLNIGGVVHERRLVPQNALKSSRPAAEAKAGNHIAWVIDAKMQEGGFQFKYTNGQLAPLR